MHLPREDELRAEATALLRDLLRIDTSNPPDGETPAGPWFFAAAAHRHH